MHGVVLTATTYCIVHSCTVVILCVGLESTLYYVCWCMLSCSLYMVCLYVASSFEVSVVVYDTLNVCATVSPAFNNLCCYKCSNYLHATSSTYSTIKDCACAVRLSHVMMKGGARL